MEYQIKEIRRLVDRWFSFAEIPPAQDIMPHLVFLLEKYDQQQKDLVTLEASLSNYKNQESIIEERIF